MLPSEGRVVFLSSPIQGLLGWRKENNKFHNDFPKVKEVFQKEPGILNSAWDWGDGDWKTALGAAAHMDKKVIAIR
jgi:hypothetical protein